MTRLRDGHHGVGVDEGLRTVEHVEGVGQQVEAFADRRARPTP
jgi:hypothetical protein